MKFGVFDHIDEAGVPRRAAVRGAPGARSSATSTRGLPRLPPGRAPRHAARARALAERLPRRRDAAHDDAAPRAARLLPAALSPAAAHRRGLHARPPQRRAAAARRRARRVAGRGRLLRRRLGQPARALRRELRDPAQGPGLRRADPPRRALRLRRRADDAAPRPAAASAAVVRHLARRPRASGRPSTRSTSSPCCPPPMVRPITDAYRAEWEARGRAPQDIPFMGVSRLIVVAETDDEAMSVARRAYRPWFESLNLLWRKYDVPSPLDGVLPEDFVDWHNAGARLRRHARPRRASTSQAQIERGGDQLLLRRPRVRRHHLRGGVAHGRPLRARDHPRVRSDRGALATANRARASPPWSARWRRRGGAQALGATPRGGRRRPRRRPWRPRSRA